MKLVIYEKKVLDIPESMQDLVREALANFKNEPEELEDLIGDIESHYGFDELQTISAEEKQ